MIYAYFDIFMHVETTKSSNVEIQVRQLKCSMLGLKKAACSFRPIVNSVVNKLTEIHSSIFIISVYKYLLFGGLESS